MNQLKKVYHYYIKFIIYISINNICSCTLIHYFTCCDMLIITYPIISGMILYTFIQFHSTPAIVTSVFIGLGIVFCGCAMVHNVFVWQRVNTYFLLKKKKNPRSNTFENFYFSKNRRGTRLIFQSKVI